MGQDISTGSYQDLEAMKKYSGFSPGQVEMIREKFDLMADEDLTLQKDQFSKLMKISEKEADKIFDIFDLDSSGRIDSYEFICGLSLLSQASLNGKAELIFNLYDFDRNRTITSNELVILVKTTMTSLNAMAAKPEATIQEAESKCKEILSKFDTNKDSTISLKEFQSFITKDSDVLKMLFNYGLISKEDLRPDFGGSDDMPECDSDLENEIHKAKEERDERVERITNGIEHNEKPEEDQDETIKKVKVAEEEIIEAPWQKTVKLLQPSEYKQYKGETNPPCAYLDIDYVHGYRCHDTRNNLKYTPNGELIYHTAAIGIVLDTSSNQNQQQYFLEHNDDIVCLDAYENYVVTGQLGAIPLLCVWETTSMQSKIVFRGVLKNGIGSVCFSNDGKKIAAAAMDEEHTIAIYDLEKAIMCKVNPSKKNQDDGLMATGKLTRAPIFDIRFDQSDKVIIVACLKEIQFISFEGGILKKTKGIWDKQNLPQSVLCIGFIETNVITGMFKGQLFVWKGNRLQQSVSAHQGPITAMCTKKFDKKGIITGGRDGVILVWDNMMKQIQKHDLREFRFYSPRVVAICEDKNGKIAIGTRSSEIAEIIVSKHKTVIKGHWDGELWGLTIHTKQPQFFTVGEDNLLACWDIKKKIMLLGVKLDFPAKSLNMSSNGKYLAVGCLNGSVLIVDPKSLVVTFTFKDRDKQVSCIKFSPDNEYLAVAYGAPSCEVLIYSVRNHFKNEEKLRGSTSKVTHMDFSRDGKTLMCNNSRFELLFFDLNTKPAKLHKKLEILKDEKWETYTCIMGWHVQGIWPPCSMGLDINSVDRSSKGDNVIVTGDDFSKIKLFRYPCARINQSFIKTSAHAAQITNVRFSADGDYIISTGGQEKSIIQWRYNYDSSAQMEQDDIYQNAHEEEEEASEQVPPEDNQTVKHFLSQIGNSTPSNYKPSKKDNQMPTGNITLSYVHGFRCFQGKDDARNMCKYLGNGKIAFISAGLGIIMDPKNTKNQQFFQKHKEDIISMAIHPKGNIVATGQMAAHGELKMIDIYIWESESRQILGHINDFHRKAIQYLEFSPDGTLLMTVGQDDDNSIAIYDWIGSRIVSTSKVDKSRVNAVAWKDQTEFVSCGQKHVKFWCLQGRNLKCRVGTLGRKLFEAQTTAVYAFNTGVCITGGVEGNLYIWVNNSVQSTVNAHSGKVGSMVALKNSQLITGGSDGKIFLWIYQNGLQKSNEILDLQKFTKFDYGIVSLDCKNEMYLIGTKGAQIYEMKQGQQQVLLLEGHYDGEVWGLATHPKEYQYITCGGDKIIRLWDMESKKMISCSKPFECDIRAIDWEKNGQFIAVGDVKANIYIYILKQTGPNGYEFIESDKKASKFSAQKKTSFWIEDIKISPDGTKVAFGAHVPASHVEVWDIIPEGFKLGKGNTINAGLNSGLTHLDWSMDSQSIIINSANYELKFISVQQKGKDISASATRDIDWFTWTCTLGWYSQGIFPQIDGIGVQACCRSNGRTVLAAGDDWGKVCMFQYPVCIKKQVCKQYQGHSSRITRLRFSYDDRYLITVGGQDKSILVWETDFMGIQKKDDQVIEEEEKQNLEEAQQGGEKEGTEIEILQEKKRKLGADKFGKSKNKKGNQDDEVFGEQEEEKSDDFLSVKPWLGSIKEPSWYYKDPLNQSKQPQGSMTLEFVFGYRAKESRNNIKYLKNGGIVYHSAALGIVMDTTGNTPTQKFFDKHTDDITCLEIHPDGVKVATGQIGAKSLIYVWDTNTLVPLCTFKGQLTKGIISLSFSLSGDKLAAAAIDQNHEIAVFDITAKSRQGGVLLCKDKGGSDIIQQLTWKSDVEFATAGIKHFNVWTLLNTNLRGKVGSWGKNKCSNILNSLACNQDDYVAGGQDGSLQIWKGNILNTVKLDLHKKSIDVIVNCNGYILTGGQDYKIYILDKTYNTLYKMNEENLNIKKELTSFCPEIKAVWLSSDNKLLVIGTAGGEIYELSTKDAKINTSTKYAGTRRLMTSHYAPNKKSHNELWGMSTYLNDNDQFATCSDDGTLRVWSINHKRVVKQGRINLDEKACEMGPDHRTGDIPDNGKGRCVAISPDGEYFVVGFKDGTIKIYDKELNQKNYLKVAKEWISDIKFSPQGDVIAIGSHDNAIYVYTFPEMKTKCKPMRKHSSYITHLDFSIDGNSLHSNCGAYELLFWDVASGKQITQGTTNFRDEKWTSLTTPLSWPTQGIWPDVPDGSEINCCDRTRATVSGKDTPPDNFYLLATGDDNSKIKIFRFPCVKKNSQYLEGIGHSSFVTQVKWNNNDEYLISIGGADNSILVWKVSKYN